MSLQILINWMEEEINTNENGTGQSDLNYGELLSLKSCLSKAKELNKNKTYTQQELDELLYHAVIQGCDHWEEQG